MLGKVLSIFDDNIIMMKKNRADILYDNLYNKHSIKSKKNRSWLFTVFVFLLLFFVIYFSFFFRFETKTTKNISSIPVVKTKVASIAPLTSKTLFFNFIGSLRYSFCTGAECTVVYTPYSSSVIKLDTLNFSFEYSDIILSRNSGDTISGVCYRKEGVYTDCVFQ